MSLHVSVTGAGPDLVFLHGWALHSGVWDELSSKLTVRYRVHCIDLPGHGLSDEDADIANLPQLAQRIARVVPTGAAVVGWSLGGLVALELATQMPLRALALISTTPKFLADSDWPNGMRADVFSQFVGRLATDFSATVEDFLSLQVRGEAQAVETLRTLKSRLLQHPPSQSALQWGLKLLRDNDLRTALPQIKAPVLIVCGANDRITPPGAARYLAEHLQRAQLLEIRRAGHAPFISHRSEVLAALEAWLARDTIHD